MPSVLPRPRITVPKPPAPPLPSSQPPHRQRRRCWPGNRRHPTHPRRRGRAVLLCRHCRRGCSASSPLPAVAEQQSAVLAVGVCGGAGHFVADALPPQQHPGGALRTVNAVSSEGTLVAALGARVGACCRVQRLDELPVERAGLDVQAQLVLDPTRSTASPWRSTPRRRRPGRGWSSRQRPPCWPQSASHRFPLIALRSCSTTRSQRQTTPRPLCFNPRPLHRQVPFPALRMAPHRKGASCALHGGIRITDELCSGEFHCHLQTFAIHRHRAVAGEPLSGNRTGRWAAHACFARRVAAQQHHPPRKPLADCNNRLRVERTVDDLCVAKAGEPTDLTP